MDPEGRSSVHTFANAPVHETEYSQDMADEPRKPHFLREWRKLKTEERPKGMTQEELAEAIGTTKSQISELERFNLQLSPKWLHKIAPVLGVNAGHILDQNPDELSADIIEIWSRIPERDRPSAAKALRGFVRTGTTD